jgi:Uma2 family endonuclease
MATTLPGSMTAEEFYDWLCRPENDDRHFELDRGQVVEWPLCGVRHGFVCANVACILGNHALQKCRGYVCCNNTGVVVERNPGTVLGPDVAYFPGGGSTADIGWFFAIDPPALVVEVFSPHDSVLEMSRRVRRFLDFGVAAAWVIEPEEKTITVYQAGEGPHVLEQTDDVRGGGELAGFRCQVARFFALPWQEQTTPTGPARDR